MAKLLDVSHCHPALWVSGLGSACLTGRAGTEVAPLCAETWADGGWGQPSVSRRIWAKRWQGRTYPPRVQRGPLSLGSGLQRLPGGEGAPGLEGAHTASPESLPCSFPGG